MFKLIIFNSHLKKLLMLALMIEFSFTSNWTYQADLLNAQNTSNGDLKELIGNVIIEKDSTTLMKQKALIFSNNEKLSKQLIDAGEKVEEKLWRMPLHKNYDKLMNSKNADMQNINYVGGAGSTTAAQFLQRFIINKTPWAHLDIAGMAFSKYAGSLNSSGATGYGVRLLDKFVEDNYE